MKNLKPKKFFNKYDYGLGEVKVRGHTGRHLCRWP